MQSVASTDYDLASIFCNSRAKYVREEIDAAKQAISKLSSNEIEVNKSTYFKQYMTDCCKSFSTALNEFHQENQISSSAKASTAANNEYSNMLSQIGRDLAGNSDITPEEAMNLIG